VNFAMVKIALTNHQRKPTVLVAQKFARNPENTKRETTKKDLAEETRNILSQPRSLDTQRRDTVEIDQTAEPELTKAKLLYDTLFKNSQVYKLIQYKIKANIIIII
jgi:hypothetical protein